MIMNTNTMIQYAQQFAYDRVKSIFSLYILLLVTRKSNCRPWKT
uniref:Uncharacterized protein n=1 Tax=Arundo donax TaxID=35708 RepID=A0A0A9AU87_ARUDO